MQRQIRLQTIFFAVVVAGICVMIAGCGKDMTATPKVAQEPVLMTVVDTPDDGVSMGRGRNGGHRRPRIPSGNMTVLPGVGGTFTVGRFTVTIPPKAIDDPINLTITDYSKTTGYILVELGPHGYQFNEPVTLSMNLRGTTIKDHGDATILWWDEENEVWIDMEGKYDHRKETVTAYLDHFSTYGAAGRSGW